MPETSVCRECQNYVPADRQIDGSYRLDDGTCICRECGDWDSWTDF